MDLTTKKKGHPKKISPPKKKVKELPSPKAVEVKVEEEVKVEKKTIGVESINIIIDALESVSVLDILSNENPDISIVTNNLLAIS